MNSLTLETEEIAKILFNKKTYNNSEKILIKDRNFNKEVLILLPSQHYLGKKSNFTFLPFLPVINEMNLIEIFPSNEDYFIRFLDFFIDNKTRVKTKVVKEEFIPKQKLLLFLNQEKKNYTTFSFPFLTSREKDSFLIDYSSVFTIDTQYKMFPSQEDPLSLHSIAFVYDLIEIPDVFQEIEKILTNLKKFFPKFNFNLFSTPLSPIDFDIILQQHSIVHFAGHIDKNGLLLNQHTYYNPSLFTSNLNCFLFLNGCTLDYNHFLAFIDRGISFLFYFIKDQLNILVDSLEISTFYLALFLGYRIGDITSIFSNKNMRFFGWSHQRFQI